MNFTIRPALLRQVLFAWAFFLVVLGGVAHYLITNVVPGVDEVLGRGLGKALKVVGLHGEPALQHWYSALALLVCSIILGQIAILHRRRGEAFGGWVLGCLLFAFLATDEAIQIHEGVLRPARQWIGANFDGQVAWMLFALVIAAVFIVLTIYGLYFLKGIEKRTRTRLLIAGGVFFAGAIGIDMLTGALLPGGDIASMAYILSMAVEEMLEMTAVIMMLDALLAYVEKQFRSVTIAIGE